MYSSSRVTFLGSEIKEFELSFLGSSLLIFDFKSFYPFVVLNNSSLFSIVVKACVLLSVSFC